MLIQDSKNTRLLIWVLSIAIPVVVAILLFLPSKGQLNFFDVSFLPHLNAALNSATSILLLLALIFIKQKNIVLHKSAMLAAVVLSTFFLVSYVLYHTFGSHTLYGDINGDLILDENELAVLGTKRLIYLVILVTHIILAVCVVPLVLFALLYGINNLVEKHKKIVKFAWPIWFYVAVTGVVVYLMISPYYQHG